MSMLARCMALAVWLALMMAGTALALDAKRDQCEIHSSIRISVNGFEVDYNTEVDNHLITLKCIEDVQLDAAETLRWLPRFTPALHVGNVTVKYCRLAHYATVLAALNVTLTPPFNLEVTTEYLRRVRPESPAHFADLPFRHLTLCDAGVLHDLPASLETLKVDGTNLSDDILEALPRTLTELRLENMNITRVPAAVLDLPELRSLHVSHLRIYGGTVERGQASRLQQLYVFGADAALMSDWAPPALEEVTLWYWRAKSPNPIPACDKLVKLTLVHSRVSELPPGWVARCPRLKVLDIWEMDLQHILPARLLENAMQLTSLGIKSTHLSMLPAQLFADTPHLTHLDLNGNDFKQLPSALLTLPLLSLDLGYNDFNTSVVAEIVAAFPELRSLSLYWNQKIGDLCAVNNSNVTEYKLTSSLASLSKLERLELQGTAISVICSDWREDMVNLTYLDLSYTRIFILTYEALQFKRNVPAVVKFSDTIYFTAEDYDRAAAAAAVAPPSSNVTIILTASLDIIWDDLPPSGIPNDCNYYWIVKAFNGGLLPLHNLEIYDTPLETVRADLLFCDTNETCAAMC